MQAKLKISDLLQIVNDPDLLEVLRILSAKPALKQATRWEVPQRA